MYEWIDGAEGCLSIKNQRESVQCFLILVPSGSMNNTRLDFCSIIQVRELQKVHSDCKFLQTVLFITLAKLAHAESLGWVIKHFSCWKSSIQKNRVKFVACATQKISAPCGTPWPTFVCGEGSLLTANWNLSVTYESLQLSTWPLIVIMLFSHCYKNVVISGSSILHRWDPTGHQNISVVRISTLMTDCLFFWSKSKHFLNSKSASSLILSFRKRFSNKNWFKNAAVAHLTLFYWDKSTYLNTEKALQGDCLLHIIWYVKHQMMWCLLHHRFIAVY